MTPMARTALTVTMVFAFATQAAGLQTQARDTTAGYPIRDPAVVAQCSSCHAQDSTGRLSRISFLRKTPEGWETSIRRMATLNGAQLDPAGARAALRYLANEQGLAPEEARPGFFEAERRVIEYTYQADRRTEDTCRACHSMGRVITQRRTRDEWGFLVAMHRGFYPDVDFQSFRRSGPRPDTGNALHPMEVAIAHLSKVFPLTTPEWTAWKATMRPARVAGTWLLTGTEPGRGRFFGSFTVTPVGGTDDEFTTDAEWTYARTGQRMARQGRAMIYTGYQWRGRSSAAGSQQAWREVMLVEPGWQSMSGRWFTGEYDEFGMDVTLMRTGANPVVTGVYPQAMRAGGPAGELRIHGANLPQALDAAAIDLGPGVRVERVVSATPTAATLLVSAQSGARVGSRDLFVAGASMRGAVVVYDSISRIRVTPAAGMARVGGENFPKQFQQFDAHAWNDGADGKPDTPDDLDLGPIDVTWSLEEYGVTFDDDDVRFVGAIDATGLFTPAADGPNPGRRGSRNNVGDVWVVATHRSAGTTPKTWNARAHLLVTVPLYTRWEPWRIER